VGAIVALVTLQHAHDSQISELPNS
jgi:hypothetical protein